MTGNIEVFRPQTIEEALTLKDFHRGEIAIVAGGTDFMVSMKLGLPVPPKIMDITCIPELRRIEVRSKEVFIGACSTFSDILESDIIRENVPVLFKASSMIGSCQIRNRATIGGNLATSSPAADALTSLMVYNTRVQIISKKGQREVSILEFNPSYRKTVLKEDELIAGVSIPVLKGNYFSEFYKVGTRKAQAIAKVSLACIGRMKNGRFSDVRFAAGSVGPRVLRLKKTEAYLVKKCPVNNVIERARKIAMEEINPVDDIRSTAYYRRTVTGNLLVRFIKQLAGKE